MCVEAVNWAWKQQLPTVGQKLVLLCLAHRAHKDGKCWPSIYRICEDTGMSDKGVRLIIKELCHSGIIECTNIPGEASIYLVRYSVPDGTEYRTVTDDHYRGTRVPDTSVIDGNPPTPPIKEKSKRKVRGKVRRARAGVPDSDSLVLPGMTEALEKPEKPEKPDMPDRPDSKPAKSDQEKLAFGEFGNVRLTEQEHDKLVGEYGAADTEAAIRLLDLHIGGRKGGDPYKSHYMAMKKWVYNAVYEQQRRAGGNSRASPADYLEQRKTWQQLEDDRKKQEFFDLVDQRKTNKPAWMPAYD